MPCRSVYPSHQKINDFRSLQVWVQGQPYFLFLHPFLHWLSTDWILLPYHSAQYCPHAQYLNFNSLSMPISYITHKVGWLCLNHVQKTLFIWHRDSFTAEYSKPCQSHKFHISARGIFFLYTLPDLSLKTPASTSSYRAVLFSHTANKMVDRFGRNMAEDTRDFSFSFTNIRNICTSQRK